MCGRKPCRKCAAKVGRRRKKVNSMRKLNFRNVSNVVVEGVQVYAGIAAGKALTNNVPQLQGNPLLGAGAQVAISIIISGQRSKLMKNVATGMAANAAATLVNNLMGDLVQNLGITGGPGGSFLNPGVSGGIGATNKVPLVRVQ